VEGKISVAVISSNRLLRESIAHVLTNKRDFEVLTSQPPGPPPASLDSPSAPDVWVSDSLECFLDNCTRWRDRRHNGVPGCVLVAMQDDPKQFLTAVSHGVLGYVLQEASALDIVAAIRGVAQGEAICPAHLARVLFDYVASRRNDVHGGRVAKQFRLTRRERQLVPLVGRGLTNKEIAVELNLSEQTIKSHIHRILRKTGVEGRFAISAACEAEPIGT
jgi:DNA-binding NarL/FixJ family response regulator